MNGIERGIAILKLHRPTLAALIAMGLCCPPAAARKVDAAGVPIIVGGAVSTAACPRCGDVVGLDPQGDNFLSVRSGPGGAEFVELDRIHTGQHLKICDMSGPWFAVVYDPDGDTGSCDVDRPWAVRQAYAGRCRQGWVYSRYVNPTGR